VRSGVVVQQAASPRYQTPPFILNSSPQLFRVSLLAMLMISPCGKYSINMMPLWSQNIDAMIFFTEMVIFQLYS